MFQALQSAAAGLISSANRVAAAAQNVVVAAQSEASLDGMDASDISRGNNAYQIAAQGSQSTSGPAMRRLPSSGWRAATSSPLAGLTDLQNPPKSLEEELINLKIASETYKANAAVFRTINQTTGSLLALKI